MPRGRHFSSLNGGNIATVVLNGRGPNHSVSVVIAVTGRHGDGRVLVECRYSVSARLVLPPPVSVSLCISEGNLNTGADADITCNIEIGSNHLGTLMHS